MFHNLCDFIKDELKELDRKIGSGSNLSTQELQYADLLAHMKKSLLTVDAMEHPEEYSHYNDGDYSRGSYSRGRARDSRGRYMSRSYMDGDMKDDLHELMEKAPNERVRRKLEELMNEMDR